jgi:hypothetical protein
MGLSKIATADAIALKATQRIIWINENLFR